MKQSKETKQIYQNYSDAIMEKRINSIFPLRRYVHRLKRQIVLNLINHGQTVLDSGCGEGSLAVLMAQKGCIVTACDISLPNIENAKKYARREGVEDKINFLVADAENLPFEDNSFDVVVSSHVLEHLPDFEKGLNEIKRVTKKKAIIAVPTCLNFCSAVQLGGGTFWQLTARSFLALILGLAKITLNIFGKGVNESYAGNEQLPHLSRYPWTFRAELKRSGFKIKSFEAETLCLPFFNFLLPLIKFFDRHKKNYFLKNLGYGSLAVVEKL